MPFNKMNIFVHGIVFVLLAMLWLPSTESSVALGVFKDPEHPGKCVVKPNLILSPGQSAKYPGIECARIECGTDSVAEIQTCGVQHIEGHKALGRKFPDADYPDCCERHFVAVKNT